MIASIGDSITAGTGANANNILEVLNENRGVTYSTGGDGRWTNTLTLANILKQFNPYLKVRKRGDLEASVI